MGFDPVKVVRALSANGGKEEEALQSLLSDSQWQCDHVM